MIVFANLVLQLIVISAVPIFIFSMFAAYGWHCFQEERDYQRWAKSN